MSDRTSEACPPTHGQDEMVRDNTVRAARRTSRSPPAVQWLGGWPGKATSAVTHAGTRTLQTAQVAFTVSYPPVAVVTNKPAYAVGENISYLVTGPPNTPISWSSWLNGVPTGENDAFYGHYTDANGRFTATVGPWTDAHVGRWTKQVRVAGQTAQVSFDVS